LPLVLSLGTTEESGVVLWGLTAPAQRWLSLA